MVTYKRTREAVITAKSVSENLIYPKRSWYIADDGSPKEHVDAILSELSAHHEDILGFHNEKFFPDTYNCGKGWNLGLQRAHAFSEVVLWLEDDWHLDRKLDIQPYVKLLMERTDIGLVRLGGLAVGSDVRIVGYDGIHYLEYLRNTQYAYSGNPLLRHARFMHTYGLFAEDRNPGDIELDYDGRFRASDGPTIWRPVDLGGWGIFGHIGTEKSFA
jgi:hypothetical protein